MKHLYLILFIVSLHFTKLQSQNGFTSNNDRLEEIYEKYSILHPQENLFQDVKPYNREDIMEIYYSQIAKDSTNKETFYANYLTNELNDFCYFGKKTIDNKKKLHGFFYPNHGSFAAVNADHLRISFNPILELKAGRETANDNLLYTAYRGVEVSGNLYGVLNFYGQFTENQTRPYQYIHEYGNGFYSQNNYNFNPYYTYWKDVNNNTGYDFSNSIGYVEYRPVSHISVMMGHDRNHYGYGYRSLFLGDNGAPYFQLKANAQFWKFHYQALFSQFTGQYERGTDRLLPKKFGAFHLLTFKASKKLEMGLFEGIVFHRNDGFDLNYLNPIIFYHSIEHSLGSSDNSLMGFQAKYNLNTHTQFYTQFLLDDIQVGQFAKGSGWWGNKYGVQLGTKFINIANVKNLDAQIEFNAVRPYTYSHYSNDKTDSIDNYTHYNQPLAHPFGANFIEGLLKIAYQPIPNLKFELKYNYSERGLDSAGYLMGNNIFGNTVSPNLPREFDNKIKQGIYNRIQYLCFSTQYQLFHNIFLDLDLIYRSSYIQSPETTNNTIGFNTGLRVNLRKRDYMY